MLEPVRWLYCSDSRTTVIYVYLTVRFTNVIKLSHNSMMSVCLPVLCHDGGFHVTHVNLRMHNPDNIWIVFCLASSERFVSGKHKYTKSALMFVLHVTEIIKHIQLFLFFIFVSAHSKILWNYSDVNRWFRASFKTG